MKNILFDALKKSTADYAEIRFETDDYTNLSIRKDQIDSTSVASFAGGVVRACSKGGWGVVSFDSIEKISEAVEEACQCAAYVGREKTELADIDIVDREIRKPLKRDFRGVELSDKISLIEGYNGILMSKGPEIETSAVQYADRFRTVFFANTQGSYFMEERPMLLVFYSATARKGDLVQRTHDLTRSITSFDDLLGKEKNVEETAERAIQLLKAPKVSGGKHNVILNQKLGGVFIHEAFGHLSEADFLYENPKMRDMMKIGTKVGVDFLNVVDDGTLGEEYGTFCYDDEGTPTRRKYLIKDGELSGHLHSRETAAKMGEAPTGNARAQNRTSVPIVRMTNTYVENGTSTKEELFKGVDNGIYACDCFGGQTMLEMFTFSAGYGYRIENGEIGELVRDVVLTGNVFQTMKHISGIADDLEFASGTCGKGGQTAPIGDGSPHIRIDDVVIGGE